MADTFIFSFKPRFVNPVRAGVGLPDLADVDRFPPSRGLVKRQTIRAERKDGKRPKPGDELHLFTGMRTKACLRIVPRQVAFVREVTDIIIVFAPRMIHDEVRLRRQNFIVRQGPRLHKFALADGFANWSSLREFWEREHPRVKRFEGFITFWQQGPPA